MNCKFIHGFPSIADVDDEAAIRLEAAQRSEGGVWCGRDSAVGGASAGSSRRHSSVPAQGIMSAGGGMGSRAGIDRPNALERGDRVKNHIVDTWHRPGLFTAAVLGSPPCVAAALSDCLFLQHEQAMLHSSRGRDYQAKPASNRDAFNCRDPTSVFVETVLGAELN